MVSRLRPRARSKSNSSNDFRAGNRAARIRASPLWDSRADTSRCRHAARYSSWLQFSARARSASRAADSRSVGVEISKERGVPQRSHFIAVSGVPITGSTMNLPQPHGQWRHPARASRPGSRDPRSHVARPLQRPLDGSRWWCWQSSQFSCLRCHFRCSPVCSGDHKLCVRTRRGSLVRANRTKRDLRLLRIVLKGRCWDAGRKTSTLRVDGTFQNHSLSPELGSVRLERASPCGSRQQGPEGSSPTRHCPRQGSVLNNRYPGETSAVKRGRVTPRPTLIRPFGLPGVA